MDNNEKGILKTILYSDIFHYPLTLQEIWLFFIGASVSQKTVKQYLPTMSSLDTDGVYYVIKGRNHLISRREERVQINDEKMKKVHHVARWLFYIPTLSFIGVSGSVAMYNASKEDDIDLFVITRKNTVWITRLLLLCLIGLFGMRRKKGDTHVSNKLCLNMLIDESSLRTPSNKQDIYIAHEIVQVVPIRERNNTYKKFLQENIWVSSYLANAYKRKHKYIQESHHSFYEFVGTFLLSLGWIECIARNIQVYVMRKHITSEIVTKNVLAFHPHDYRKTTMKIYTEKIKKYEI